MPDRPPAKLVGLPDGNLNGLGPVHDRAVREIEDGKIPHAFLLVEVEGDDVTRKLSTGVETLKLRVIAVEELPNALTEEPIGANHTPAELLTSIRAERIGVNPLDLEHATDHNERDRLLALIKTWRAGFIDLELDVDFAEHWHEVLDPVHGDQLVPGWRDAPASLLREFLLSVGVDPDGPTAQEAEDAAELQRTVEEDGEHPQEEPDQ